MIRGTKLNRHSHTRKAPKSQPHYLLCPENQQDGLLVHLSLLLDQGGMSDGWAVVVVVVVIVVIGGGVGRGIKSFLF